MRTHDTGVVSSNPAPVAIETSLVMKATRSQILNSTPLQTRRASSLVSAKLEIEYAMQFFYSNIDMGWWHLPFSLNVFCSIQADVRQFSL